MQEANTKRLGESEGELQRTQAQLKAVQDVHDKIRQQRDELQSAHGTAEAELARAKLAADEQ